MNLLRDPWISVRTRSGGLQHAGSRPAFMQDLDLLVGAEPVEIARLLIDNPGEKTTADSNDRFIMEGL